MSLSRKSTKFSRQIISGNNLKADKKGNIYTGELDINPKEFASVLLSGSNAEALKNSTTFKFEVQGVISDVNDILILTETGKDFTFSGKINFVNDDYADSATFDFAYNKSNDYIKEGSFFSVASKITLVDVTKGDKSYIGLKFDALGSYILEAVLSDSSQVVTLKSTEYDSYLVSTFLSNSMFRSIPDIPKIGMAMRNVSGTVNSKNNKFYLYPGCGGENGLATGLMYPNEIGFSSETGCNNVFEYNPETNSWREMAPFPEALYMSSTVEYKPGKNMIINYGVRSIGIPVVGSSYFYIHDIENDTYERLPISHQFFSTVACIVNDIIYVFCGRETTYVNSVPTTMVPFFGLYKYNLLTGEETYIANKYTSVFNENVANPTAFDQDSFNSSVYLPELNSIIFTAGTFRNNHKGTVLYKFDVATEEITKFMSFDFFLSVPKIIRSPINDNKLIMFTGVYGEYTTIPNVTGNTLGGYYTSSFRDIIEIDFNTKDYCYREKLPYPGFVCNGIGIFKDKRVIIAGGCTNYGEGESFFFSDPDNKISTGLMHSNHAMIINFGKSVIATNPNKISRLIPLNDNCTIPNTPVANWYNAQSTSTSSNKVYTILEKNKVAYLFDTVKYTWTVSPVPAAVNYRLNMKGGAAIDFDDEANTIYNATDPSEFSLQKINNFNGITGYSLVLLGSTAGTKDATDSSDRTLNKSTLFYFYSPDSDITWTAGKPYFKDNFYTSNDNNRVLREYGNYFYNSTQNVFYMIGGKDEMSLNKSSGYGVYSVTSNSVIRCHDLIESGGSSIPLEKYAKYGSALVSISDTECIVFGGTTFDENGDKVYSSETFKLSLVNKGDTYLTPIYTQLPSIPIEFESEGWMRATKINTNEIVLYAGRAKNYSGTLVFKYYIDTNKFEMVTQTRCFALADLVKTPKGEFYIPFGMVKGTNGAITVTPPFKFINAAYKPKIKFSSFGISPTFTAGNRTETGDIFITSSIKVLDVNENIHYFGGTIGAGHKSGELIWLNSHWKAKVTENSDGTFTLGTWQEDTIPSSLCQNWSTGGAKSLPDGRIVLIGGLWNLSSTSTDLQTNPIKYMRSTLTIFDPVANTYTEKQPTYINNPLSVNVKFIPGTMASLTNNPDEILIFGGYKYWGAVEDYHANTCFDKVFKYSISANTLTYLGKLSINDNPDMAISPFRNYAAVADNGTLFCFSSDNILPDAMGNVGKLLNNQVSVFDTVTNTTDEADVNGLFKTIDLTKSESVIPAALLESGRVRPTYINLTGIKHSNGNFYIFPWVETKSTITAGIFNPYNKKYNTGIPWQLISVPVEANKMIAPVTTALSTSTGIYPSDDTAYPEMFELKSGKIIVLPGMFGSRLNKSIYINGLGMFVVIS